MKVERPIIFHKGIFKPASTVGEAVFVITGMTIGAGVLGIPYVVAQVGLWPGLFFILFLGLVMLSFNLMIGEVAVRTREPFQLPGLAGKYLGLWAKRLLGFVIIFGSCGALLAYIVGEGQTLAALFGGNPLWWSVLFWSVGSFVIWRGLQTLKRVDKVLSLMVIAIIIGLSLYLLPRAEAPNLWHFDLTKLFLPYGVILFALHGSPAIAEAHALLPGSQRHFRKALVLGALIPVAVYMLFALAVVGVTGLSTTEVATIGLGERFGAGISALANLFAALAMGTAFMGVGMALKQTLTWDHKLPKWLADVLVMFIPLGLFLLGLRSFILILDLVGGLFIGIEALIMVLVYWQAKKNGDMEASRYRLPPFWLLAAPVLLVFTAATVYSIVKLFI